MECHTEWFFASTLLHTELLLISSVCHTEWFLASTVCHTSGNGQSFLLILLLLNIIGSCVCFVLSQWKKILFSPPPQKCYQRMIYISSHPPWHEKVTGLYILGSHFQEQKFRLKIIDISSGLCILDSPLQENLPSAKNPWKDDWYLIWVLDRLYVTVPVLLKVHFCLRLKF